MDSRSQLVLLWVSKEAVNIWHYLRFPATNKFSESMIRVLLPLLEILQDSSSSTLLVHPDFRVDADVADQLEAADANSNPHGCKQRIHLRSDPAAATHFQDFFFYLIELE